MPLIVEPTQNEIGFARLTSPREWSGAYLDDRKSQPADWPRILKILGNAGYQGYLALEYESTDAPLTAVPKLVSKMREVIRGA